MKKAVKFSVIVALAVVMLSSCGTVVQPNYGGVLMENYGKNGKADYTEQSGRVSTWGCGTELFQVPMWQRRAQVEDTLKLQDCKNNEMKCFPKYAYQVLKGRLVDVVFNNSQLAKENSANGDNFLTSIENNILEAQMYDIIKEQSRKHSADSLMTNGGSLRFEKECEELIKTAFSANGFTLQAITIQLTYSNKIMETLDKRLEVSTNVSTLDQEIIQQKKKNELEQLRTDFVLIQNKVLTPEYLENKRIDKWDGHLTQYQGIGQPVITIGAKK